MRFGSKAASLAMIAFNESLNERSLKIYEWLKIDSLIIAAASENWRTRECETSLRRWFLTIFADDHSLRRWSSSSSSNIVSDVGREINVIIETSFIVHFLFVHYIINELFSWDQPYDVSQREIRWRHSWTFPNNEFIWRRSPSLIHLWCFCFNFWATRGTNNRLLMSVQWIHFYCSFHTDKRTTNRSS